MNGLGSGSPFSIYRSSYPDPFLDQASTRLPKSQQKLFELLYIFATTHPQIKPIVTKLAKYPITKIICSADGPGQEALEKRWESALEKQVNIYEHAEGMGLDYMGYGNSFITVHRPFVRSYRCDLCKQGNIAQEVTYFIRNKKFVGTCPSCKKQATFEGIDTPTSKLEDVRIVRIPPMQVTIIYNDLTGEKIFYRDVPQRLKDSLKKDGKPDKELIDRTPWVYIKAALEDKKIRYAHNRILHLCEPSLSSQNQYWGMPIIMAALKDAYLNQVFKKADETVANERTVPARFVYPQMTSQDPLRTISLSRWSGEMARSLAVYRNDKNAIIPVPFPVGVAEIGGDAQRLMTHQLRELLIKEIVGSTGVPEGFLSEGMTFSGGSVQIRMLENMLSGYIRAQHKMLDFVIKEVSTVMKWPLVEGEWKPFKKSDDVQMLQMKMQLAQSNQVSYKEILESFDLDWEEEHRQIMREKEGGGKLASMDAISQARAALESVTWQVETQSRQESYQELKGNTNSARKSTFEHLGKNNTFDGDQEQQQEEGQANQEQEQEQQQGEERAQNAITSKREAEAQKKDTEADLDQESYQNAPMVNDIVKTMLTLDPNQRERKLQALEENAPGIALRVRKRLEDSFAQEGNAKSGLDISDELKLNSKDPEELANKIMMLPSKEKSAAFNQLLKSDPQLAMRVAKIINGQNAGRGGASGAQSTSGEQNTVQPPKG
jgi:hypothetical protein